MSSIFTRIIQGEIPCHKVAETENCIAFLDISPLAMGHTLVVPKEEVDYLFDIEDELYQELWALSKRIAYAMEQVVDCERIGVAVIGLEVPHAHIHLIPLQGVSDINFERPKLQVSHEALAAMAADIRLALESRLP
jgi:histidine triad (HIT) family protein